VLKRAADLERADRLQVLGLIHSGRSGSPQPAGRRGVRTVTSRIRSAAAPDLVDCHSCTPESLPCPRTVARNVHNGGMAVVVLTFGQPKAHASRPPTR